MRGIFRTPQLRCEFMAGDPATGYYNDLTGALGAATSPEEARAIAQLAETRRSHLNPVSQVQLGLGAWQRSSEDDAWSHVAHHVADWIELDMDGYGRLAYHQPMAHTFNLPAPWYSAMAQGQAISLLVRASGDEHDRIPAALRAAEPLLYGALVADTDEGPVLQEYPTIPPAHVLNGWVFGLWGLYDLANSLPEDHDRREVIEHAWNSGVDALAARLDRYELRSGWTTYDLYPHPLRHAASPFYHRLHCEQMAVMAELTGRDEFAHAAERWSRVLGRPLAVVGAVARKVSFRVVRPRRKAS